MSVERRSYKTNLDQVISEAQEIIFRDRNHAPTLIAEGEKKIISTEIPGMPDTHGERMGWLRSLGTLAAGAGIGELRQVFIVTEGWMSLGSEEKPPEAEPSEDPDRKEVLMILGRQILENRKYMKVFEIMRDNDQEVVTLEEVLPDDEETDKPVAILLVDAFVEGFQTLSHSKYN